MAILFSKVTMRDDYNESEFLVGGFPHEADDLEGWTAYHEFLDEISEDTVVNIRAQAFLYGEGETVRATPEEVAYMHLMLYSTNQEKRGYIDKKGIDNLRHLFGTEIFKYELADIYNEQTKQRDLLNADARDEITALADKIKNGLADNGEFVMKFVALAKRMQSVSGKKVYGYLPKSVKAMVNELVDLLEKDEDINRIYELWYQAKCAVYATYTDNPPPRKPLSQEEAFKPIRNAMIKEADELGKILLTLDNEQDEPTEDSPEESDDGKSSKGGGSTHTSDNTDSGTNTTNTSQPKTHSNYTAARNGYIATSITRFGNSLSRIFRDRFDEQAKHAPMDVDSRLKREIEAKKKGQNISM